MKGLLRELTPPVLWAASKWVRDRLWDRGADRLVPRYFGLQELDKKLERHLNFDGGFFVEVGGWDGITFSNSLYFERYRHWKGVLVEPSPSEFLKCHRNRPAARVFCCACVPFDYPQKYVPMIYCAAMTVTNIEGVHGVALDPHSHVENGEQFLSKGEVSFEFGAVAKPLSALLSENQIEDPIDLLILDVEGYELPVLRGLDFNSHAPRFICVEAWDLEAITGFLLERQYEFVEQLTKHDHLFRRRAV